MAAAVRIKSRCVISVNHESYEENPKTGVRAKARIPVFGQTFPILGFTEF